MSHEDYSGVQDAPENLRIQSKAIIAGVSINTAAERLHLCDNLRGSARGRALHEHASHEHGGAVVGFCFRQDPALANRPKLHERQAMILFDQQTEPPGEVELL